MQVKLRSLKVNNDILGKEDTFLVIGMEDYNEYDKIAKKTTDVRLGTKYTVVIHNPQADILYEKLEVKVVGACTIPTLKNGEDIECKFVNLQLNISNIEYGKCELRATADRIELVTTK